MDNTFFDIRVLAIYAQHLRHKHIIIKQEQTPVAQNFPQQKTTWKILSGWRFNTIVTTSLPYSIYSGKPPTQGWKFVLIYKTRYERVLKSHTGNPPVHVYYILQNPRIIAKKSLSAFRVIKRISHNCASLGVTIIC